MNIKDFAYPLPDERIAKYPLARRDASKLLLYQGGQVRQDVFSNLPAHLPQGALLVMNNTRVIYARLHFRRLSGALIEVFCLEPLSPADYQLNFAQTAQVSWVCMVGNLKKWKGDLLARAVTVAGRELTLTARLGGCVGTGHEVCLSWGDPEVSFSEVLDAIGELPIPPYLNRKTEQSDLTTYQTVYSKVKGSVAAPTAGLHFTPQVLQALEAGGVERQEVTLHVGAGTFRPVKSERVEDHAMHAEWISVGRTALERLIAHDGHCIAVGTTSVRTLESLYYIGLMLHAGEEPEGDFHVPQWLPYTANARLGIRECDLSADDATPRTSEPITAAQALQACLDYLTRHQLPALNASTQIIIMPGYRYHVVRGMITNFHQPQSTLLLLVSAFVGGDWRTIYDYALAHDFRFLSYGDSSLLLP